MDRVPTAEAAEAALFLLRMACSENSSRFAHWQGKMTINKSRQVGRSETSNETLIYYGSNPVKDKLLAALK